MSHKDQENVGGYDPFEHPSSTGADGEHDLRKPETSVSIPGNEAEHVRRFASEAELLSAIEALLFAAGDPLAEEVIADICDLSRDEARAAVHQLKRKYQRDPQSGLMLREVNGSYLLSTRPELVDVVGRLYTPKHRPQLSQAAYETLAVVAYNQPVTRAQVEMVRGVNSDSIITRLVERGLIREVGNLDLPGRPAVFEVTEAFLLDVGLRSTNDLPAYDLLMYDVLQNMESKGPGERTRGSAVDVTADAEDASDMNGEADADGQRAESDPTPEQSEEDNVI